MSGPSSANSVGERLRDLRRRLGLSQEQLARRLGVSFATVNRWESGRTQISARSLAALAELEATAADDADADADSALPAARSSFVGRERELAELAALLRQSRLVTLIGPGGAGKSRLAAEAVSRRAAAEAEIVFVALEQIRHPRTIASALASRLQVHDQQGTPLIESLQSALAAEPRKLLLLDGAERLADQVAELAGQLLDAVPELRIVVTSRTLLGRAGRGLLDRPARSAARPRRRRRPTSPARTRSSCSSPGRASGCPTSAPPTSRRTRSPSSAAASTACRWRSS